MGTLDQYILAEDDFVGDSVVATYLLQSEDTDVLKLARTMATEQTTGTWVDVPGEKPDLLRQFQGRVVNVWEVPDVENRNSRTEGPRQHVIQLAFPWDNFGGQIPMLLTTVFGNISMIGNIKLLDLQFPRKLTNEFPGPKFGIQGIRKLLGVKKRPLLNNMIKPSTGLSPKQGAELLYQAAVGGTDIIKDDEVLGDRSFSPVLKRVSEYGKKLEKAEKETGEKKLYAVNVTDDPDRCIQKAEKAVAGGARAIMVNYLTTGMGTVSALARNRNINVPILAHLDFGGALYSSPLHGISSPLLYGKLARLAGVDMLCIPTPYGKFALTHAKYMRIVLSLRGKFHAVPATFPIVGGAIKQGHTPRLVEELGCDFIVGAGGAIHAHPMGSTAGAMAFRQAIDWLLAKGSLEGATEAHPELKAALALWK